MRIRLGVLGVAVVGLMTVACSDDEKSSSNGGPDAAAGAGGAAGGATGGSGGATGGSGATAGAGGTAGSAGTGGTGGAGADVSICGGLTGAEQIDCGKYLVEHVSVCIDCHSPRLPTGAIDPDKILAGTASFADLDPTDDTLGNVPTPNLTQLATEGWTADEVKAAVLNGERSASRGGGLFPIMPYFTFHNMADADASAIAAFILSLEPIDNAIPTRQPLPSPIDQLPLPVPAFPADQIPDTTLAASDANYEDAQLGKYLASQVGVCMECHTGRTPFGSLDPALLFAGGEEYEVGPPFGTVTAANITPHSNGIAGWTVANVENVLLQGVDDDGVPICPPMPAGPMQAYGGLRAAHATAIARYITTLPAVDNGPFDKCQFPMPPGGDGGAGDGGAPDGSASDAGGGTDASAADGSTDAGPG